MRDFLINLILVAVLAFFIMQTYQMYQNHQRTINDINSNLQSINIRLSQFESVD